MVVMRLDWRRKRVISDADTIKVLHHLLCRLPCPWVVVGDKKHDRRWKDQDLLEKGTWEGFDHRHHLRFEITVTNAHSRTTLNSWL